MDEIRRLRERQEELLIEARALIDKITDDMSPDEAAKIERDYDRLMAEHDRIDRRARLLEAEDRAERPDPRRDVILRDVRHEPDGAIRIPDGNVLRPEQRVTEWLARRREGRTDRSPRSEDFDGLRLGRFVQLALGGGPRSESELRALQVGSDAAGGYAAPERVAAEMLDLLRAQAITTRLGARVVMLEGPGQSFAWPQWAQDPTPAWRSELDEVAEDTPQITRRVFEPKSLGVLVKVSVELLQDASPDVAMELERIITAAMALELDRVALIGSGTAPEPLGLDGTTGIGSVAHNATLDDFSPIMQARGALLGANSALTGVALHPRDENTLAGLTASDGQPLMRPEVLRDVPFLTSTQLPTNLGSGTNESVIYAGRWADLWIGSRLGLQIRRLTERFADTLEVGFLAVLRADIGVVQPKSFVAIRGVQPT